MFAKSRCVLPEGWSTAPHKPGQVPHKRWVHPSRLQVRRKCGRGGGGSGGKKRARNHWTDYFKRPVTTRILVLLLRNWRSLNQQARTAQPPQRTKLVIFEPQCGKMTNVTSHIGANSTHKVSIFRGLLWVRRHSRENNHPSLFPGGGGGR